MSEFHQDTALNAAGPSTTDGGLDRPHDVVAGKPAGSRELDTPRTEIEQFGDASDVTRARIAAVPRSTATEDHRFEAGLAAAPGRPAAPEVRGEAAHPAVR